MKNNKIIFIISWSLFFMKTTFAQSELENLFYADQDISYLSKILVANKENGRFLVLSTTKEIEKNIPMASGKEKGDKEKQGDLKTPEGLYRLESRLDKEQLKNQYPKDFALYGTGAIISNYPNPLDLLHKKTGNGIWIHGTDNEDRISKTFDSRGCFVVPNKEMIELLNQVELDKSILLSFSDFDKTKLQQDEIEGLKKFIETWKTLWKKEDPKYFDHYSESFSNDKIKTKSHLVNHKQNTFKNTNIFEITLKEFFIFKKYNYYYISFTQDYKAESNSDFGLKELWVEKSDNTYKIVYENWFPFK